MVPMAYSTSRTERAPVVVMMPCIAAMPVPIMCPTVVYIPPIRVVTPIPWTMPCKPGIAPKPVVDNRSIDIHRLDDIVGTIHILVTNYLDGHFVLLVFLYVYRGYILKYIFSQDSLKNDQTFVTFARLNYAQIINLSVSVQIQITECAVRVIEHRLELFQVLSLRKQLSYNIQIESFRDVRTVGRNRDRFVCP